MWGLVLHVQALKASWLILKTTYIVIHKRDGPPYLLSKLVHASQDMCTRKPFLRPTAKLDGKLGSTHMQTFSALGNAAAVSDIPTRCAHVAASIGESRNWGAEPHKGNLLSHPTTVHYPSKFYYGLLGLRTYPDFFSIQVCFVLPSKLDSLSGIGWPRSIAPSTRINEKNLRKPLKGWRLLPRSAMQKENWWCHNLKLDAIQAHMLGWQLHFRLPIVRTNSVGV